MCVCLCVAARTHCCPMLSSCCERSFWRSACVMRFSTAIPQVSSITLSLSYHVASGVYSPGHNGTIVSRTVGWLVVEMLNSAPLLPVPGCSFTVLVHTREAATRNMEKVQVIKVRPVSLMLLWRSTLCIYVSVGLICGQDLQMFWTSLVYVWSLVHCSLKGTYYTFSTFMTFKRCYNDW